jgi:hypothetical protein
LPNSSTSGITKGWFLSYNASSNATSREAFAEDVMQSSNASAFCTSYTKSLSSAPSAYSHFNNSANGFDYSYLNGTLGPYYSLTLVGCKSNYIVTVSLLTGNSGVASTAAIADQISATIK